MDKKMIIIIIIAVSMVIGLKLGENHVIRHQSINKTDYGYRVEFDGDYYDYFD